MTLALPLSLVAATLLQAPGRTPARLAPPPAAAPEAHWVDWNGDGAVDLHLLGSGPDRLLLNTRAGSLESVGARVAPELGRSRSAAWADLDGDGEVELVRIAGDGRLEAFRVDERDGAPRLRPLGLETPELPAADDVVATDFDGDGLPDLLLVGSAGAALLRNLDGSRFVPAFAPELVPGVPDGASAAASAAGGASFAGSAAGPVADLPDRPGGDTPDAQPTGGGSSVSPTGAGTAETAGAACALGVEDQATAACLAASSAPVLGMLYPLSADLFVDVLGRVGVGTTTPAAQLDVAGTVRASGLQLPAGATSGHVLTSDAQGQAGWSPLPASVGGSGSVGTIPRFTGAAQLGDSALVESGSRIGAGTSSPASQLHVKGGPLDLGDGSWSTLRVEGGGMDGTGGRLDLGAAGGADNHLVESASGRLEIVSDVAIGLGPGPVSVQSYGDSHALNVGSLSEDVLRLIGPGAPFGHGAQLNFGDGDYVTLEEDIDDRFRVRSRFGTLFDGDGTDSGNNVVRVSTNSPGKSSGAALWAENVSTADSTALVAQSWGTATAAVINNRSTGPHLQCSPGGGQVVFEVQNDGRVVCSVLEVTGGADLVEGFDTSGPCPPGTVLAIDPDAPGRLRPSDGPYDPRVAGVVSGAGGVSPGIRLAQAGVADGDTPVAMAGRVFVRCSDENGPVRPGDLLTSSSTPGVAMRATDPGRSFGAVLGKALGARDESGLVLALVNLQ